MMSDKLNLANKQAVRTLMSTLAQATPATVERQLAQAYHPDAQWRGSHPWNEAQGVQAIGAVFWQPLLQAFPDLERRDSLLIGGHYQGRDYVGAVGHFWTQFARWASGRCRPARALRACGPVPWRVTAWC
jgi:hypothetical protein